MVFPARLVLFRTVVVVEGVENRRRGFGGGAEVDGRLAAVGTDFEPSSGGVTATGFESGVGECMTFVERHETSHTGREGQEFFKSRH